MNIKRAFFALGLAVSLCTIGSVASAAVVCTPIDTSSSDWPKGNFTQNCTNSQGTNNTPQGGQQIVDTLDDIANGTWAFTDAAARLKGFVVTAGDQLSITISDPAIPIDQQETITYTVQSGEHLSQVATGLAAAINANADLQTGMVSGSSFGPNVYISDSGNTSWTVSTSGGATETMTINQYGVALGGTTVHPFGNFYMFYQPSDYDPTQTPSGLGPMINAFGETRPISGWSLIAEKDDIGREHKNVPNITAHELGHWMDYIYPQTGVMKTNDTRAEIHGNISGVNQVSLTITNSGLPGPSHAVTVSYTSPNNADWENIAEGLAAAINADSDLTGIGITATAAESGGGGGPWDVWIKNNATTVTAYSGSVIGNVDMNLSAGYEAHMTKRWRDALATDWYITNGQSSCSYDSGRYPDDHHPGLFTNRKDPSGNYFCTDVTDPNVTNIPVAGGGTSLKGVYVGKSNREIMQTAWPDFFVSNSLADPRLEDLESAEIFAEQWAIFFNFTDWKYKGPNAGTLSTYYVDRNFQLSDLSWYTNQFPCTREIIDNLGLTGDPNTFGPYAGHIERVGISYEDVVCPR